eukprot:11493546-Heterocapsa_arctica.AAC.1
MGLATRLYGSGASACRTLLADVNSRSRSSFVLIFFSLRSAAEHPWVPSGRSSSFLRPIVF